MSLMFGGFNIPSNIFSDAITYFWEQRDRQAADASGGEGQGRSVRGGMHLDGVQAAIVTLMLDHGVPANDIFANCALHKTGKLELPGFFRPTKQWDLLVVRDARLLAVMELKAQVGPSFGNNFNNRTEEAMEALWTSGLRTGRTHSRNRRSRGLGICSYWKTMRNLPHQSGILSHTFQCSKSSEPLRTRNGMSCSAGSSF